MLLPVNTIALAGDWHGNTAWALSKVAEASRRRVRTILHVGDFGIWPGEEGADYVREVDQALARHGVQIFVTPGNHEEWPRILRIPREHRDEFGPIQWLTDHLAMLPRGHRFTLDGVSFVSLGGASSVGFERRIPGTTWWPEEEITSAEAADVAAAGYADVMLAHDAPNFPWQSAPVTKICATNPRGWSARALGYAASGRERMTTAFLGVQPRVFVHGHYHVTGEAHVELPDRDHDCHVVSLNCDGSAGNMAWLDLPTLTVSW